MAGASAERQESGVIKKIKEGLNVNDLNDSKINNKHYTKISKTIIIFSNLVTDTINNTSKQYKTK
jgi:hypothetical protein